MRRVPVQTNGKAIPPAIKPADLMKFLRVCGRSNCDFGS